MCTKDSDSVSRVLRGYVLSEGDAYSMQRMCRILHSTVACPCGFRRRPL